MRRNVGDRLEFSHAQKKLTRSTTRALSPARGQQEQANQGAVVNAGPILSEPVNSTRMKGSAAG